MSDVHTGTRTAVYRRRHKHGKGTPLYPGVENGPRRIVVTLDAEGFRRMSWLARKRKVPMATVLRDAVWAYCLPIAADADTESAGSEGEAA